MYPAHAHSTSVPQGPPSALPGKYTPKLLPPSPLPRCSTHWKALCLRYILPLLNTMLVLDLRSCVEEVTEAMTSPWLSVSMMMRFLDSCSWIRITCAGGRECVLRGCVYSPQTGVGVTAGLLHKQGNCSWIRTPVGVDRCVCVGAFVYAATDWGGREKEILGQLLLDKEHLRGRGACKRSGHVCEKARRGAAAKMRHKDYC